ncbi:MAG: hypothetical protein BWY81_00054 [Firmicutes bacterium ADurb.Bin467]|nr:MAG: hypothetical protein BWY81_00054 [Firmicutes bacterium ADurb.Bin467]
MYAASALMEPRGPREIASAPWPPSEAFSFERISIWPAMFAEPLPNA